MLPDHYVKIHDHGFVGLVDHMGSDAAIVEAAAEIWAGEVNT
tara:strand:+ start:1003 stop:1128 length:126 start_codon:yes stop_codon:yes gene_type:complete